MRRPASRVLKSPRSHGKVRVQLGSRLGIVRRPSP
jgi:hypothetical protein